MPFEIVQTYQLEPYKLMHTNDLCDPCTARAIAQAREHQDHQVVVYAKAGTGPCWVCGVKTND